VSRPVAHSLRKPKSNLGLSGLHSVGTVTDVASDSDAQVATDGAGGGLRRLGSAEHDTTGLDGVLAFPYHATHGTRHHVVNKTLEESLGR